MKGAAQRAQRARRCSAAAPAQRRAAAARRCPVADTRQSVSIYTRWFCPSAAGQAASRCPWGVGPAQTLLPWTPGAAVPSSAATNLCTGHVSQFTPPRGAAACLPGPLESFAPRGTLISQPDCLPGDKGPEIVAQGKAGLGCDHSAPRALCHHRCSGSPAGYAPSGGAGEPPPPTPAPVGRTQRRGADGASARGA